MPDYITSQLIDAYRFRLLQINFSSLLTVAETGLRDKLLDVIVSFAYKIFVDKEFVFNLKTKENVMVLDEIKIAIGPYILGIGLTIVVFLLEKWLKFSNRENSIINGNESLEQSQILGQYFHNYLHTICIFIGLSQKMNG